MQLFIDLQNAITSHRHRNAFLIDYIFYSYDSLAQKISQVRSAIRTKTAADEKNIGFIANDDLETYATIIALWFEGKVYIPLSPEVPKERNESIIKQAFIKTIIDSSDEIIFPEYNVIESKQLLPVEENLQPVETADTEPAYILFTSGTTGLPKGVPITRANLSGFTKAFWKMGFSIDETDRCLQMFELTFDLSIMSYLIPLLKGACVYTIPKNKIKYSYIGELLEEQRLTVALMVPSMLSYLRPYFDEIDIPEMRYSLFCGEALHLDIVQEWAQCLPNAEIFNVYGPTEDTIFCTHYQYTRTGENKSNNGILSIGKAMDGTSTVIINENDQLINDGSIGQLCLGGIQLTPGYWENPEKNREAFFMLDINGKKERFYRTGDICSCDEEGDMLYLGRMDSQIKIQGFRVELSEIEFHAKKFLEKTNAVVVAYPDPLDNIEIGIVFESGSFDTSMLFEYLKTKLPVYMIPKGKQFVDTFPLNSNGKTDRKKLTSLFKTMTNE